MNFYSSMEEMTEEYFPVLHYNKKRYGFYFLNSEEYVFQHEGKMLFVSVKSLIL